jgi:hypothetical protein
MYIQFHYWRICHITDITLHNSEMLFLFFLQYTPYLKVFKIKMVDFDKIYILGMLCTIVLNDELFILIGFIKFYLSIMHIAYVL